MKKYLSVLTMIAIVALVGCDKNNGDEYTLTVDLKTHVENGMAGTITGTYKGQIKIVA